MLIEKNINGYFVISDLIKGYLVKRIYMGYSKLESIKKFKEEFKK